MTLVAAGNVEAMNTVARRLSGRVRRVSRGILRNEALADDAAQIALVEILQSARTFGGRSSLERWADRITARISLRQARDERRRSSVVDSLDDPEAGPMPMSEREPSSDVRSETALIDGHACFLTQLSRRLQTKHRHRAAIGHRALGSPQCELMFLIDVRSKQVHQGRIINRDHLSVRSFNIDH